MMWCKLKPQMRYHSTPTWVARIRNIDNKANKMMSYSGVGAERGVCKLHIQQHTYLHPKHIKGSQNSTVRKQSDFLKWAKGHRHLTEEDTRVATKHMKRQSTLSAIKNLPLKPRRHGTAWMAEPEELTRGQPDLSCAADADAKMPRLPWKTVRQIVLKTALLRCQLPTIKFTHSKRIIKWLLV